MTQQEYEQKKMECWHHLAFNYHRLGDIPKAAFDYIFERAYALGKHEKDAEGEEMLTCVKDQAVKLYDIANKAYAINGDEYYEGYTNAMIDLFGSKCLPDEEPKPAEPTETFADKCKSQCKSQDFDTIIKDGFRGHNRLHIAAQIVAALYANYQAAKGFKSIEELVRKALDIADTLIKESEKGD